MTRRILHIQYVTNCTWSKNVTLVRNNCGACQVPEGVLPIEPNPVSLQFCIHIECIICGVGKCGLLFMFI